MYTFELKIDNSEKELIALWVIRPIKYASLEYRKFKTWNVKVDCKPNILDEMRNFLKTQSILDNKWEK